MKTPRSIRYFIGGGLLALASLVGICAWPLGAPPEPEYSGKRLSVWADELVKLGHLRNVTDTNATAVQAVRDIGTNAIPWALHELTASPPFKWRLNQVLQKQNVIRYQFPISNDSERRRLRARSIFWALGDAAKPAIPRLLSVVEKEPDLETSALAGIGDSALPALEFCLTNNFHAATNRQHAQVTESALRTLRCLYVALDVGRISKSEAMYLLPAVRQWQTNGVTATRYWADAVLREVISTDEIK